MLGIDDAGVLAAYVLCIASTLLCIIYGLATWNKGEEGVSREDVEWAQEEKEDVEEVL